MNELHRAEHRIAELEAAIHHALIYLTAGKTIKAVLALAIVHKDKDKGKET